MLSVLEILIKIGVFKNWKKQKLHPRFSKALTLFAIRFLSFMFVYNGNVWGIFRERLETTIFENEYFFPMKSYVQRQNDKLGTFS